MVSMAAGDKRGKKGAAARSDVARLADADKWEVGICLRHLFEGPLVHRKQYGGCEFGKSEYGKGLSSTPPRTSSLGEGKPDVSWKKDAVLFHGHSCIGFPGGRYHAQCHR